jgi:hypothetical protein
VLPAVDAFRRLMGFRVHFSSEPAAALLKPKRSTVVDRVPSIKRKKVALSDFLVCWLDRRKKSLPKNSPINFRVVLAYPLRRHLVGDPFLGFRLDLEVVVLVLALKFGKANLEVWLPACNTVVSVYWPVVGHFWHKCFCAAKHKGRILTLDMTAS